MFNMYRDPMSLVQKKTTITLKLKQVCATLRQQVHTGIAMAYTRIQSHIAAYMNNFFLNDNN